MGSYHLHQNHHNLDHQILYKSHQLFLGYRFHKLHNNISNDPIDKLVIFRLHLRSHDWRQKKFENFLKFFFRIFWNFKEKYFTKIFRRSRKSCKVPSQLIWKCPKTGHIGNFWHLYRGFWHFCRFLTQYPGTYSILGPFTSSSLIRVFPNSEI